MASRYPPAWVLGTTGLSVAKILENMEIGHNILHGQWDWMNDPNIHSSTWDWDTASTGGALEALPQLPPPHLHEHRRHGQGRRLRDHARRSRSSSGSRASSRSRSINVLLMLFFEWGVALHDLDLEAIRKGTKDKQAAARASSRGSATKIAPPGRQGLRRLPGAQRPQGLQGDARRERHGEHRPQHLVERDHLLRPLPRPGLHLHRGGGRRREPRAPGTSASSSAPRTSRAATPST